MLYLRLAGFVIFALVVAALFYYRAEAATAAAEARQAVADRNVAVAANKVQEETIGRMRAREEQNAIQVAAFIDEIEALRVSVEETNKGITELSDENQGVRDLLNSAVPADLQRLLNK